MGSGPDRQSTPSTMTFVLMLALEGDKHGGWVTVRREWLWLRLRLVRDSRCWGELLGCWSWDGAPPSVLCLLLLALSCALAVVRVLWWWWWWLLPQGGSDKHACFITAEVQACMSCMAAWAMLAGHAMEAPLLWARCSSYASRQSIMGAAVDANIGDVMEGWREVASTSKLGRGQRWGRE